MDKIEFWKYARDFSGSLDIEQVFVKFAIANNITGIKSALLWNHISQDIASFSRYGSFKCADMTIDPNGTIHITSPKDEPESGEEPTADKSEGVTENTDEIKQNIQENATDDIAKPSTPLETKSDVVEPTGAAPSTVFNRL